MNDSCLDPLDYMLLPTPPLVDEEGIWKLEREDLRGRGRGSHKAFMIWKVRARFIKCSVQDPSFGAYLLYTYIFMYSVNMTNCKVHVMSSTRQGKYTLTKYQDRIHMW